MSDAHLFEADVEAAALRLLAGELVAFPTETVYGLGADATNAAAVDRIFTLKGRPRGHPVIVHVPRGADLEAFFARDLPLVAHRLMEQFWPGPLTLILNRQEGHASTAAGGQPTIGLRCPDHAVAQQLLQQLARMHQHVGLAAPSANRFGHVSPTTAAHVREEFGPQLAILDGGPCRIGIESTILDLSRYDSLGPVLLRPGGLARAALAEILGREPLDVDAQAPRVSGSLASHYAPAKPLILVDSQALHDLPGDTAVWAFLPKPLTHQSSLPWLRAPADPSSYANLLYAVLRELDGSQARTITIERPPENVAWEAIIDRLKRAAVHE